jgi:hypothetical protein
MPESRWENANTALQRAQSAPLTPIETQSPTLAPIDAQIAQIRSQKLGVIASFKANKIERTVALTKLKALTDAQLEASTHALRAAVGIEKERINVVANKYIYQLNEEYLTDLGELGLKNLETRMNTLLKLNQVVAGLIAAAEAQNVPASIIDETVQAIASKRKEFFDRILEEAVRLPK